MMIVVAFLAGFILGIYLGVVVLCLVAGRG